MPCLWVGVWPPRVEWSRIGWKSTRPCLLLLTFSTRKAEMVSALPPPLLLPLLLLLLLLLLLGVRAMTRYTSVAPAPLMNALSPGHA
jgi:hypothetical protein